MNEDSNNFDSLRKLMALKRHEQPPPGYFDRLPGSIASRLEQGQGRLSLLERFYARFALHPGVAYACGMTVCGALGLTAVLLARQGMRQGAAADPGDVAFHEPGYVQAAAESFEPVTPPFHVANWRENTNPVAAETAPMSLFDYSNRVLPVSYPGRN